MYLPPFQMLPLTLGAFGLFLFVRAVFTRSDVWCLNCPGGALNARLRKERQSVDGKLPTLERKHRLQIALAMAR